MIDIKRVGERLRACCNRSWPHTILCRICDAKEGGESELKSHYDTKHNTIELGNASLGTSSGRSNRQGVVTYILPVEAFATRMKILDQSKLSLIT